MPQSTAATTPQLRFGVDYYPVPETDMATSSSWQVPAGPSSPHPAGPWSLDLVWLRVRVRLQREDWVNLEELASWHSLPTLYLDLPSET